MSQIPLVRRSPVPPDTCNLAKAIDLIGDRWTLLILRAALYGVRRFDDFQSELGCPRTVLSGRLKKLVDAGLLDSTRPVSELAIDPDRPDAMGRRLSRTGRGASDQLYEGGIQECHPSGIC